MEDQDTIRQLQQEVAEMQQQMQQQYNKLLQLQQRLGQLQKGGAPAPRLADMQPFQQQTLENFIGLRLIHLVGIVVLVIGVSIGVKYAFDRNLISEMTRIALAYAAGGILLFFAFRLKKNYERFSAILFSGAMATFYFTTYAAHVYYSLMSFGVVFGLMVLLTVFTAFQAMRYNRSEIALLGLIGAYGIPFLISKNAERADLFFLYIFIINCGVLFLRVKKDWRLVGRVAQVITWFLFIGWTGTRYTPAQQATGSIYLLLIFAIFSVMALAFAYRQKRMPVAAESQQQLLNNIALYVGAVFIFAPRQGDAQLALVSLLCGLFAALQAGAFQKWFAGNAYIQHLHYLWAIVLAVLATAFYLDGLQVTMIWLLMAVGLFGIGAARRAKVWRLASLGLMALTLVKLLVLDSQRFTAGQKVIAYITLGLLLLVVSFFYQKFRQRWFDGKE